MKGIKGMKIQNQWKSFGNPTQGFFSNQIGFLPLALSPSSPSSPFE
jgi:hypothetical protein